MLRTEKIRVVLRDGVLWITDRKRVDDVEVEGVFRADVHYKPDDFVRATLDVAVRVET